MFMVGFVISLALIGCVQGEIHWTVERTVSSYGQELVLYCTVERCCSSQAGWFKNDDTIFLDVRILYTSPHAKYDGLVNRTGFSLIIRNLKETDLNQKYRCSHGFNQSNFKVLNVGDAFTDPSKCAQIVETRQGRRFEDDEEKDRYYLILHVIVPVIAAGFIIIAIGCIITTSLLRHKLKKTKPDPSDTDIKNHQITPQNPKSGKKDDKNFLISN